MMAKVNFKFLSDASAGDGFTVVSFSGNEAISRLYRYQLEIKAPHSAAVNLDDVLNSPATFITIMDGEEFPVHGVLASIDELQTVHGYVHYQVVLVPRLWWLSIYKTNEIYTIEKTIDQIIQLVLENADFNSDTDFDLSALNTGDLIQRDYRCQFGESDFDFLSRLMENEGIFYYFDQSGDAEKIVFVNDMSYLKIVQPELIFDVSTQTRQLHDSINAWSCRKQRLPANVTVRDYNPDHPSLDISGTATVDSMGIGTEYHYGDNLGDENEAGVISEIRAEERLCNKTRYYGESSVPRLQAGYVFNLDMHPNEDYNGVEYLTLEVNHSGQNLDMSMSGESQQSSPSSPQYHNNFVAIEAGEQYRPDRITPKPRFFGTMTAFVYAEAGNNLAEIDEFGRYRVHLPFDRADGTKESTDPDRKASTWIRKAQDYVGEGKGSYFPLTGGTEVVLSFINGDPDQPIIVGAVPNASEPSLMNSENEFESRIQTGSGNKIRMGDVAGEDRIVMESPMANSWMRVGEVNDPITLQGSSPHYIQINTGAYVDPEAFSTAGTTPSAPFSATEIKDAGGNTISAIDTTSAGKYTLKYSSAVTPPDPLPQDYVTPPDDTAIRRVIVYDPADDDATRELEDTNNDGIRIHSAGNIWMEAQSRYGSYHTGAPPSFYLPKKTQANEVSQIGDMIEKFGFEYNPSGLIDYSDHGPTPSSSTKTVEQTIGNAHVHVSSLDTFNTQEGNVYDFGGYWTYNLGNGFTESHVFQQAELNLMHGSEIGTEKFFSKKNDKTLAAVMIGEMTIGISAITSFFAPAFAAVGAAAAANAKGGGASGAIYLGITAVALPIVSIGSTLAGLHFKFAGSIKNVGDVIEGPKSGVIKTWAEKVGSSFDADDASDPNVVPKQTSVSLKQKFDAQYGEYGLITGPSREYEPRPMHTDTTWVEKKFGDSYNFNRGNTIDITHGNTEEHVKGDIYTYKYGGLREETSFSKGFISHWKKSGHGASAEVNWDKASGQIANFSYSYMGLLSFKLTLPTSPKLNASVSLSSLDGNISIYAGTAINVKATTSIALNVEIAGGFSTNFKSKVGGELNMNEVTGKMEFKAFGFKAAKAEALKAEKKKMVLDDLVSKMSKSDVDLAKKNTSIVKLGLGAWIGQIIYS